MSAGPLRTSKLNLSRWISNLARRLYVLHTLRGQTVETVILIRNLIEFVVYILTHSAHVAADQMSGLLHILKLDVRLIDLVREHHGVICNTILDLLLRRLLVLDDCEQFAEHELVFVVPICGSKTELDCTDRPMRERDCT